MPGDDVYFQNSQTVRELLVAFYGNPFITQPVENSYTIGATATPIGQNILQSVGKFISNNGATNFAIGFSPTITITTGTLLVPGAALKFDWYYDGDLLMRPLYAISSGAGGTLYMLERCLQGV